MANFTTENNTYCFRIGPAFLDTILKPRTAMSKLAMFYGAMGLGVDFRAGKFA